MSEGESRESRVYEAETPFSSAAQVLRSLGEAGRRAEGVALRSTLKLAIEREVIPRLILAEHRQAERQPIGLVVERAVTPDEIGRFQDAVVHDNLEQCAGFVDHLRQSGVSRYSVYLGLFVPVARHLGHAWESDDLNFVDVSIGLSRLQALLNRLSLDDDRASAPSHAGHRIVLAAARGDQHVLGLQIVTEFFRMAGWDVAGGSAMDTGPELSKLVSDTWFGVVGLSASSEDKAQLLKADIAELRRSSRNRRIAILVGGHGFQGHPEISRDIGADALATDGAGAVAEAERLLARPSRPGRRPAPDA